MQGSNTCRLRYRVTIVVYRVKILVYGKRWTVEVGEELPELGDRAHVHENCGQTHIYRYTT